MTPALWLIFGVVAVGSVLLIAVAVATAPRNQDDR